MKDIDSSPITIHMIEHQELGFGDISPEDREACIKVSEAFERTLRQRKQIEEEAKRHQGKNVLSLGSAELLCLKTDNILIELSSDWRAEYIANNMPDSRLMSKRDYEAAMEDLNDNFEEEIGTWWSYYVDQLEAILIKARLCAINVVEDIYEDTDSRSLVEIEIVNSPQVSVFENLDNGKSNATGAQFISRICQVNKVYEYLSDRGW